MEKIIGDLETRRKVFHLFALLLWLFPLKFFPTLILYLTFFLVLTVNYLTVKGFGRQRLHFYYKFIYWLEREKNLSRPAYQALWANLGIFLSFLLFGREGALVGVLVLAVGDAFAGFVGRHWGRTKMGDKSLEGSLAFFLSSFVVLLPLTGLFQALVIALVCSLVELLPFEDNFTVPLSASLLYHMLL